MKRYILFIFLVIHSFSNYAQPKREQIKALKISFLTERLDLTAKEAQEFWPVYNTYEQNTIQIKHKELRSIRREIKENLDTLSNDRANTLLDRLISAHDQLHKENELLFSKLKNILPAQKILSLKVAEEDFNRKLFEQYKRHRPSRPDKD
ncbi:sensor of ECF-type sigma factor [Aestuariivivens sediminis]|uniref:sensor of ECF-type sigma factor n=1 Tax=Aestuariivivens sediminis TaxID=2913557 RepID=UPI001F58D118|nr:sensor of ECF-type sigma factor [Aestuariivivens sediminis]